MKNLLLKRYKVTWFGVMGCGYPTDEEFICYAYSKRHAHKKFIKFIGDGIKRQYTCEQKLINFNEIKNNINIEELS